MVSVVFTYDDESGKWETTVVGAADPTEAKQALNAVVLTCRDVVVGMDHVVNEPPSCSSETGENVFTISPAVTLAGLFRSKTKGE